MTFTYDAGSGRKQLIAGRFPIAIDSQASPRVFEFNAAFRNVASGHQVGLVVRNALAAAGSR
jgi:hypothetical protein